MGSLINMTFQYVFFFSSTDNPPVNKGEMDVSMIAIFETHLGPC